jgi:Ran GTPase-activating protein (RanGAP) involved in mRNA processing and transport
MADLEPNVFLGEWPWRGADDIFEALMIVSQVYLKCEGIQIIAISYLHQDFAKT